MKYLQEKQFVLTNVKKAVELFCRQDALHVSQKSKFDLVTNVDKSIEDFLKTAILNEYPTDSIISEETLPLSQIEKRTWIIDPIDGTCNMAHGMKIFGVQCALVEEGDVVLSVIVLPEVSEEYYAIKGEGAYLNGKRIYASENTTIENSIVSFGDYSHKSQKHADVQHIAIGRVYPQIAKIRMFGAACFDFSFVASRKIDSTIVLTNNLWDICPGILLCKEAGAIVTDIDGNEFEFGKFGVVASSNRRLHDLIISSLKI